MKYLRVFLAAGLLMVASASDADVFRSPATAVVLPDDGSGVVKVALRCDISGLRHGEGLTVQGAFVKCEFPLMRADRKSWFSAYRLSRPWGLLGPDALDVVQAMEAGPESAWEVFPQDIERTGRRLMKLDVTGLVQERIDSNQGEVSVLVATSDLSRQALLDRAGQIQLEVQYGFLGALAPLFRTAN